MHHREANLADIESYMELRLSVTENPLSDAGRVTYADNVDYLTRRGKGWVCEDATGRIFGFGIVDLLGHSIWALFVRPGHEGRGIGQVLQRLIPDWYFAQTSEPLWLTTAPGTRAERFYRRSGWREAGRVSGGREVKFELGVEEWRRK